MIEKPIQYLYCGRDFFGGCGGGETDKYGNLPKAKIYAFLLIPDTEHSVAKVIQNKWSQLHALSGKDIVIIVPGLSGEWTDKLKKDWQEKLGPNFEKIWEYWQKKPDSSVAFEYLELFNPPLKPDQLPCLVIFTELHGEKTIVRSLPDWEEKELYQLLKNIIGLMKKCMVNDSEIFKCLQGDIDTCTAHILSNLYHIKNRVTDYIRNNPSLILTTTASFIIALSTGYPAFALSPIAVELLKGLKNVK